MSHSGQRLPRAGLPELRIRTVRDIEAGRITVDEAVRVLGAGRSTVFHWLALYREGGEEALRGRRASGRPMKLSGRALDRLYGLIVGRDPRQYQFDFLLWTREMVRHVIRQEFGVALSAVSVGRLLSKMGLSPQRPVWRAHQQDPQAVRRWREKDFPRIRTRARKQGATLYFADEAALRSDHHAGTTWAPVGQTPVVSATGQRKTVSMLSAITTTGALHFDLVLGTVDSTVFIDFCRKLLTDDGGKVFLIVDRSPVHTSATTTTFVQSTHGQLELFFLPPYSPELNPDEWVWNNVKNDRVGRMGIHSATHLYTLAKNALLRLKNAPDTVRGFFADPHLAYISR